MNFWTQIKDWFSPRPKPKFYVVKRDRMPEKSRDEIASLKCRMLVAESEKWLFVRESGKNKGTEVEMFQREVDGKAQGEPWCAAFVMFCVSQVDRDYEKTYGVDPLKSQLFKTELCLNIWNKTPVGARINVNLHPGLICIWQHYVDGKATSNGHVGIVNEILDEHFFLTVEGNTRDHDDVVDREGDGVYQVKRRFASSQDFRLKGFIRPWDGQYFDSLKNT